MFIFKHHFIAFFQQLTNTQKILINLWHKKNICNDFCIFIACDSYCAFSFYYQVFTISNPHLFNLSSSQFLEEFLVMCHVVGAATINQPLSLHSLLENQVGTTNWSFSSWSITWASTSFIWFLFLHITASCPSWLHLEHLASGLLQHLNGGWPFFPRCWQGG